MEIPVPYMHALVVALEKAGYARGRTLRAATYDWRRAGDPASTRRQFAALQELIEATGRSPGVEGVFGVLGVVFWVCFGGLFGGCWAVVWVTFGLLLGAWGVFGSIWEVFKE